jgi:hypothetical protein
MAVDILIIRSKCDPATNGTFLVSEGLKTYLEGKGRSVTELADANASPENVNYWLNSANNRTKKFILLFDHGSCEGAYGEKNNEIAAVINKNNVEDLTKELHMYTFACSTNGNNCVGQLAISKGCYTWLGYTEPVYVFTAAGSLLTKLKSCIWSFITAMVDGRSAEEAEQALRNNYKSHFNDHWVFKYNHDRLLLRKKMNNLKIDTHNRVVKWHPNARVTGLFAHGPQNRNVFIHFEGIGWKRTWPKHDSQVVNMLSAAALAKSKASRVDFFEDDGQIKQIYVF